MPDDGVLEVLQKVERQSNAAAEHGREVVPIGPFTALLDPSTDLVWLNYAVPTAPMSWQVGMSPIEELRRVFAGHGRTLRFEFIGVLWPDLGPILEAAGLQVQARHPLMFCHADDLLAVEVPDVRVQLLDDSGDDATLSLFLQVQATGFGVDGEPAHPTGADIARFRADLRTGHQLPALGWIGDSAAGAGSMVGLDAIAELAGVATLPEQRRRGVAATLSSSLARRHFERGGTLVWLSAGDDVARVVYERIGFHTVATRLNYIDAG